MKRNFSITDPSENAKFCRASEAALSSSHGAVEIRKEFVMQSIEGRFITRHSVGGGARSFLLKLLSGSLKPWKFNFPAVKILGSPTEPANFWFSAQLPWIGIKYFNRAALLDYPTVFGPNGQHFDCEISLWFWYSKSFIHSFTAFFTTDPFSLLLQLFLVNLYKWSTV